MTGLPRPDEFYYFNSDENSTFQAKFSGMNPVVTDERYFKTVFVSPRALLTMLRHAIAGGKNEIMGFLAGRGDATGAFFVTDAQPFNVVGTETRVGVTEDVIGNWYEFTMASEALGHATASAAWYHSHPGLSPFLSEIDVQNQRLFQLNGATCALVIDPINTISSGKVQLGGYRTLRPNPERERQPVPVDIELKYGHSAYKYSELDLLYYPAPIDRAVLADVISRSYHQGISCSPLALNAAYVSEKVGEVALKLRRIRADEGTTVTEEVLKTLRHVQEQRKVGLWVERMKQAAFG
jgi:COP9 signalosome complex subunit 5